MKVVKILLFVSLIWILFGCTGEAENASDLPDNPLGSAPSGSLFYILQEPRRQALMRYDFASEESQPLFEVPVNAWLSHMAASPDGSQIAITYAPSPGENEIQFGFSSLYLLLADGRSDPRLLIERTAEQEVFFNPIWSPDSQYIYYSHVTPLDEASTSFATTLERLNLASGEVSFIADNGIWPRLSPDGRSLAYIKIDTDTLAAELMIASSDGSNPAVLVPRNRFVTLDGPLFSQDGQWLYFSAVEEQSGGFNWWDWMMGVDVALAHSLPSVWWRLPAAGGEPERVTSVARVGQYAAASPDGRFLAFSAQSGLFLMAPDGSDQRQLLDLSAADSLSWSP